MTVASIRARPGEHVEVEVTALDLARVYEEHFAFVWRSARRLGVPDASTDDVVQEVFLVVQRQLATFEGRSSVRTWLFGILRNLVARERRRLARSGQQEVLEESCLEDAAASPDEELAASQARRVLHRLLDELDDEKRAVFILGELEEMSAPEIADATGLKLNTVYSRLRLARAAVERSLVRHRAREQGGRQ